MNLVRNFLKYSTLSLWWLSCMYFVYTIVRDYFVTIPDYENKWNFRVPKLADNIIGAVLMGVHFFGGVMLLLIGLSQFLTAEKYNKLHRIVGTIYVIFAQLTSFCGMIYVIYFGTIGGINMDFSFFIYGYLLFLSSGLTWFYARVHEMTLHREWALRTYILGISSWLYRIFYITAGIFGYTINTKKSSDYERPLDIFFVWAFYPIGLILAEIYIRVSRRRENYKKRLDYLPLSVE